MNQYYLEFKAWIDKLPNVDWQINFINSTSDYRNRQTMATINPKVVQGIFMSFNEKICADFMENNIAAIHYAVVITAANEEASIQLLNKEFGMIELIGICEFDRLKKILGEK